MPALKTHESFVLELEEKYPGRYTLLEEYKKADRPILIRHNICGYEWDTRPGPLLRKEVCPKCSKKIKYNTSTFKDMVQEKRPNYLTILGEYAGSRHKIKVMHNECGTTWEIRADAILQTVCPSCWSKRKKTSQEFRNQIFELVGVEYTVLEEYTNYDTRVKIQHNICGHQYEVKPGNFIHGRRCPRCSLNKGRHPDDFLKLVTNLTGSEYTFKESYCLASEPILCRHNHCGFEWKVAPGNFLRGTRCPLCMGYYKDHDVFMKQLPPEVLKDFIFLTEYTKAKNKIQVQHKKCQTIFEKRPDKIVKNLKCPFCETSSIGEAKIIRILSFNKIKYKKEITFAGCVYEKRLRFDFGLYSNTELVCLIEFQGEQHYKSVDFFGGDEEFERRQIRDSIKKNYCKDHRIPLREIKWDEDVNVRMYEILIEFNLKEVVECQDE